MNLVLIEDHPVFREQLRDRLQEFAGIHVVHTEATAQAALHWLNEHPQQWDLLVLDVFLAQGHGFQVLRALRGRLPQQQVVLLTNYTRDPVREQARKLGANAVFDKLFELEAFFAYVQEGVQATSPGCTPATAS